MSIKDTRAVAKQDPSGATIIQSGPGGPRQMMCPKHKVAATPRTVGGKVVWLCPMGCQIGTTKI